MGLYLLKPQIDTKSITTSEPRVPETEIVPKCWSDNGRVMGKMAHSIRHLLYPQFSTQSLILENKDIDTCGSHYMSQMRDMLIVCDIRDYQMPNCNIGRNLRCLDRNRLHQVYTYNTMLLCFNVYYWWWSSTEWFKTAHNITTARYIASQYCRWRKVGENNADY